MAFIANPGNRLVITQFQCAISDACANFVSNIGLQSKIQFMLGHASAFYAHNLLGVNLCRVLDKLISRTNDPAFLMLENIH